jgi:hypothetical protein
MDELTRLALLTLVVLELKHFVFDFILQTPYQLRNKGTYGHPGGILHSGLHVAGTLLAFLVITPSPWLGVAIVVGEFVVHYHIDWAKEQIGRRLRLKPDSGGFWTALGADQLLHHLTYVAITAILAANAASA